MKAHVVEMPQTNGSPITKLVVAIHGIGDQFRYATIQAVATRFSVYCGNDARPPLGSFHPAPPLTTGVLPFLSPKLPDGLQGMAFAEVFWADIPKEAADKKDTIEETKAWAKTVVARVRALDALPNQRPSVDYNKASSVVAEMIETIGVLENILFLAEKAGILKLNLAALLTDYLGDVQIVTEFANYRTRIVREFHRVLFELIQAHPQVDSIYLVAHSEGTVVSFLGLLQALSGQVAPELQWDTNKVKGFMTLGSPIDKHIVMWPDLWKQFQVPNTPRAVPIAWRNYYDYGDPVGFELDSAREWLEEHKWIADSRETRKGDYFEFTPQHEIAFTRYPLPGKAHNDYWTDAKVFRHFIGEVIERKRVPKPRTKWSSWAVSWILPYLLSLIVLSGGVYLLYKATAKVIGDDMGSWEMVRNISAFTTLLAGLTVMARIPRLTKFVPWHPIAAGIFALCVWAFSRWVDPAVFNRLGVFFDQHLGWDGKSAFLVVIATIGLISAACAKLSPGTGLKPLILITGIAVAVVLYGIVTGPGVSPQPVWPMVLAGAAFLYLWWLAALLFDMAFVWHRYIRQGEGMRVLHGIHKKRTVFALSKSHASVPKL